MTKIVQVSDSSLLLHLSKATSNQPSDPTRLRFHTIHTIIFRCRRNKVNKFLDAGPSKKGYFQGSPVAL